MILMPLTTVIVYDGQQFGYDNPNMWIATAISYPLFVVCYLLLMLPFSKIPALQGSAMGKTLVTVITYSIKTITTVYFAVETDELRLEQLVERWPGDLSVTLILWAAIATANTASADYRSSLRQLNRVAQELDSQRAIRIRAAETADRNLRFRAISALQGELEKISHGLRSVGKDEDFWRLSVEIKKLIEERVRPLSKEVRNRIDLLASTPLEQTPPLRRSGVFGIEVAPRLDARFNLSYVVASINIFITIYQLSSLEAALLVQAVSLSFPLIAWAFTSLRKPTTRVGYGRGVFWMVSVAIIAYLPTLWVINDLSETYEDLVRIQFTAFFLMHFVLLTFSGWSTLRRARNEQLEDVDRYNNELKRELALIDQTLWVAQRKWSYLIHGTVQGALTVASSRLVFDEKPDRNLIAKVTKDLERAKRALQSPVEFRLGTEQLIREIQGSWSGICEVRFDISANTIERVDESESGKTCLIELSKELVSNAYRHGRARQIWISVYLDENLDLRIIATNDGLPLAPDHKSGLGFAMFDELTSTWAFEFEPTQRFVASIPLATRP